MAQRHSESGRATSRRTFHDHHEVVPGWSSSTRPCLQSVPCHDSGALELQGRSAVVLGEVNGNPPLCAARLKSCRSTSRYLDPMKRSRCCGFCPDVSWTSGQ